MSSVPTLPGFDLEMLANRDSLPYIEHYGMERLTLKTMFRGTLRYKGFSQLLEAFQALGLTSTAPFTSPPQSWTEVLQGSMVLAPQMMSQALLESADEVNHTLHW